MTIENLNCQHNLQLLIKSVDAIKAHNFRKPFSVDFPLYAFSLSNASELIKSVCFFFPFDFYLSLN